MGIGSSTARRTVSRVSNRCSRRTVEFGTAGEITIGLSSVSVAADGDTWTLNFNKAAYQGAGWNVAGFTATGSTTGAITFTYVSGSGTSSWTLTGSATAVYGETLTLDWVGTVDGIEDSEGVDLAAFSGRSVTNNVPPAAASFIFEDGNNFIFEDGNNYIFE